MLQKFKIYVADADGNLVAKVFRLPFIPNRGLLIWNLTPKLRDFGFALEVDTVEWIHLEGLFHMVVVSVDNVMTEKHTFELMETEGWRED